MRKHVKRNSTSITINQSINQSLRRLFWDIERQHDSAKHFGPEPICFTAPSSTPMYTFATFNISSGATFDAINFILETGCRVLGPRIDIPEITANG